MKKKDLGEAKYFFYGAGHVIQIFLTMFVFIPAGEVCGRWSLHCPETAKKGERCSLYGVQIALRFCAIINILST
jgi:hypothetical protein